ncbi:MAG: hypothetical protein K2N87_11200, partial [Eubacterium sp.]|nr:hypothetical protein [Eubacterium sp.]
QELSQAGEMQAQEVSQAEGVPAQGMLQADAEKEQQETVLSNANASKESEGTEERTAGEPEEASELRVAAENAEVLLDVVKETLANASGGTGKSAGAAMYTGPASANLQMEPPFAEPVQGMPSSSGTMQGTPPSKAATAQAVAAAPSMAGAAQVAAAPSVAGAAQAVAAPAPSMAGAAQAVAAGAQPQEPSCQIVVNGEEITMKNKKEFIFVDIFDYILFDLSQSRGRMLVTQVNGEDAQYTQRLYPGDKIDIYWKEN